MPQEPIKFTNLFEVSTLNKNESEFVIKFRKFLDENKHVIDSATNSSDEASSFFRKIRDISADDMLKTYSLKSSMRLEEQMT